MKKLFTQKLDNRGSGIVTVLVAIVFLTVLGSMLLMLSFTGFEMKVSERKGNQNNYDAEVAMAEIRTGLQEACSDAIADAMYDYLVNSSENIENATEEFRETYMNSIGTWVVRDFEGNKITEDEVNVHLMSNYDKSRTTCQYNLKALTKMIKNCRRGTITINSYHDKSTEEIIDISDNIKIRKSNAFGANNVKFDKEAENGKITFSNISVTYNYDNRETTVTTDITIDVPDLAKIASGLNNTDIESFALISAGNIIQNSSSIGASVINGSSYMKELVVSGETPITFDNGTVIVNNGISATASSSDFGQKLSFGYNTTVYANDITIEKSSISLLGNTFVANDLKLNGKSSAAIGGRYTGFGSSLKNSDKSSSIIVNGSKSALDLTGCTTLSLAGFCFISDNDLVTDNDMITGEAISVKPNQMAYLADAKFLYYADDESQTLKHNPVAYNFSEYPDASYPEVLLDTETPIIKADFDGNGEPDNKTYADYNAKLRRVIVNFDSQALVYYFITFTDDEGNVDYANAKKYFTDYFKAYPTQLNDFIKNYVTVSKSNGQLEVVGSGFTYTGAENENPKLWNDTASREQLLDKSVTYSSYFENFKKYLSPNKPVNALDPESEYCINNNMSSQMIITEDEEAPEFGYAIKDEYNNPFYHKINIDMIESISGQKAFLTDGKVTAVVCKGNYSYPSDFKSINGVNVEDDDLCFILCHGNITIEAGTSFSGLIMCSGDITVNGLVDIACNEGQFNKAMTSVAADNEKILKYFRDYVELDIEESTAQNYDGTTSAIFSLVKYENWKKN